MFPLVDTKNPRAIAALTEGKFSAMYPGANPGWLRTLFRDVENLFSGRHLDYGPVDLHYHDFEHTLQATLCLVLLLDGRHATGVAPRLTAREFELAVASVLLHDSGYLKLRSDTAGTGAKYTFCHVLRSCAFAAAYVPTLGANDREVETVLGAINCTGPTNEISRLRFREASEKIVGCAVTTADYLGQMAASDYPDELEILFDEFRESDDYLNLSPSRRVFKTWQELRERTPVFWEKFVLPRLESDFMAVYRFLAHPYPHGPNPYLEAVERNIAKIKQRLATPQRQPRKKGDSRRASSRQQPATGLR